MEQSEIALGVATLYSLGMQRGAQRLLTKLISGDMAARVRIRMHVICVVPGRPERRCSLCRVDDANYGVLECSSWSVLARKGLSDPVFHGPLKLGGSEGGKEEC